MSCQAESGPRAEEEQREAKLTQAIKDYLAEHPMAMDTVEGIAEWWIMRRQVRVDVETLTKVLHQLAEQGLLEEISAGGQVRYRLRR